MQSRPTSAGCSVQSRFPCINRCIYLCAVNLALFGFWTEGRGAVLVGYSFDVRDEDVARLSPLSFDHVNMLGRYAFILPDQIARGELRPLRDPWNTDDEG